jgi:toxin-antitoxin system PIN domain toxin
MIAVDTNILVYAHREDSPFHRQAISVMLDLVRNQARWAIPWPCVHEFLSVVTHPKIYRPPTPMPLALETMRRWVQHPHCAMLSEGPVYFERLDKLCEDGRIEGPMVHDARIAALCLDNGVGELLSADRDFSRYAGLKTRNPLV